jgi:hypothetical protein
MLRQGTRRCRSYSTQSWWWSGSSNITSWLILFRSYLMAIGARPPKQRSNRTDHTMGSGNWPVWYRIRPPTGDQVTSTHGLHCGIDRFKYARDWWVMRSLGDVLRRILHSQRSRGWCRAQPPPPPRPGRWYPLNITKDNPTRAESGSIKHNKRHKLVTTYDPPPPPFKL